MIHGHTPRPAVHELGPETGSATRIVLGDWHDQSPAAVWDETGCRLASSRRLSV